MSVVDTSNVIIPSNPSDRVKLREAISEGVNSHIRMDSEREHLKSLIADIHEKFGLPKKLVARLIKTHHKRDKDEQVAATEEFQLVYETILEQPLHGVAPTVKAEPASAVESIFTDDKD